MYIGILDLADKYGWIELAQRASDLNAPLIIADILKADVMSTSGGYNQPDIDNAKNGVAIINAAIKEACNTIDSYVSAVLALPLNSVGDHLKDIACRIARYRLARFESGTESDSRIYRDYKEAIDFLQSVASGKVSASSITGVQVAVNGSASFRAYRSIAPNTIY